MPGSPTMLTTCPVPPRAPSASIRRAARARGSRPTNGASGRARLDRQSTTVGARRRPETRSLRPATDIGRFALRSADRPRAASARRSRIVTRLARTAAAGRDRAHRLADGGILDTATSAARLITSGPVSMPICRRRALRQSPACSRRHKRSRSDRCDRRGAPGSRAGRRLRARRRAEQRHEAIRMMLADDALVSTRSHRPRCASRRAIRRCSPDGPSRSTTSRQRSAMRQCSTVACFRSPSRTAATVAGAAGAADGRL